tara:strand:+ start:100 stop:546 length:447 start_codon:yes stop_codon:yes gene_type:complete
MEEFFKNRPILEKIYAWLCILLFFGGFLTFIVFTSDPPIHLTWLVSAGLVVVFIYTLGQVNTSKDMLGYFSADELNTKIGLRYDEIYERTKKKGIATRGDLIDIRVKGYKQELYELITASVIFLLLNIIGLWSHLLNWLSELYGVQIW